MPYADRGAQRKYQARWVAARRAAWIAEHGPCRSCGSSRDLQVDHVRPSTKKLQPSGIWSLSRRKREAELRKCQVLCGACHTAKTSAEKTIRLVHGTQSGYAKRCRCGRCRAAHAVYNRAYLRPTAVSA